jgi:tRNA(Ile)-lysidine synthase
MVDSTTPPSIERGAPVPRGVLAVACSGGRDSVSLAHHAVGLLRSGQGPQALCLLHVHHGLTPLADQWWQFVEDMALAWRAEGLPVHFAGQRLHGQPAAGDSVEAWARQGRYDALAHLAAEQSATEVWLAQHRTDQAETVLLQALRGAGVAGLAAMPERFMHRGVVFVRPWLDRAREDVEAEAIQQGWPHVADPSNDDLRFMRNRVRHRLLPALRDCAQGAEGALCDVAQQAADAVAVQHAWYGQVRGALCEPSNEDALNLARWLALPSVALQRVFLRLWLDEACARNAWPRVGRAPLVAWVESLLRPGEQPARSWSLGQGVHAREYRGVLSITGPEAHDARLSDAWGRLRVQPASAGGVGLAPGLLEGATWRWREGGERMRLGPGRPARCLRKQFQSLGVPSWARQAPLLWSADGRLLFVPGLGIEGAVQEFEASDRVVLTWVG